MCDHQARLATYFQQQKESIGERLGDRFIVCNVQAALDYEKQHPIPRPEDGDHWGSWKFRQDNLTLVTTAGGYEYEVDLERLGSPNALCGTIGHLMTKRWCTPEVIGQFIQAVHDLTHGGGYWANPKWSPTEIIRRNYGKQRREASNA